VTKTYWLSFCDDAGKNFGVCVVDVTDEQAEEAVSIARDLNPDGYPKGHEWVVAAIGQSLRMGCNPGGDVQSVEIDPGSMATDLPRNRLLQESELRRRGWA
jgi:hypothetical protein